MDYLDYFDFPANLYSTEQIAWVVANFPKINGVALKPAIGYMRYNKETNKSDIPTLIIVGKRKPWIGYTDLDRKYSDMIE